MSVSFRPVCVCCYRRLIVVTTTDLCIHVACHVCHHPPPPTNKSLAAQFAIQSRSCWMLSAPDYNQVAPAYAHVGEISIRNAYRDRGRVLKSEANDACSMTGWTNRKSNWKSGSLSNASIDIDDDFETERMECKIVFFNEAIQKEHYYSNADYMAMVRLRSETLKLKSSIKYVLCSFRSATVSCEKLPAGVWHSCCLRSLRAHLNNVLPFSVSLLCHTGASIVYDVYYVPTCRQMRKH